MPARIARDLVDAIPGRDAAAPAARLPRLVGIASIVGLACTPGAPPAPAPPRPPTSPEAPARPDGPRWELAVGPDLRVDERICVASERPVLFGPEYAPAIAYARATADDGRVLTPTNGGFVVPPHDHEACVRLAIDLAAAATAFDDEASLEHAGEGTVLGSLDVWLWRPTPFPRDAHGRLRITTAPGIATSVPLPRRADGTYDVGASTWSMMARAAIGRLRVAAIDVAGGHLEVASLPGAAPKTTPAGVRAALGDAGRAVATLDGTMPSSPVQVLLRPGGRSGDPVAFGMAMRGGGPSVMLFVSDTATDASIHGEWVAVHELSHLWVPPVDAEASWLTEGFATYYQNVLRSRAGLRTEAEAWGETLDGFDRGARQARVPLRDARRPRFQQIYWGGAAIMLRLDLLLRERGTSLDAVASRARRAKPEDDDDPSVDEVIARWSRAAGFDLAPVVDALLQTPFPDPKPALDALGIRREGGRVVFDDRAPAATIRRAIGGRR